MTSKQEVLAAVYKAFNERDIDAVLTKMRLDVDWPNGMEGGRVHGHAKLREYWMRQWAVLDPQVEPVRFEEDDMGRVIVHVHQVVRDLAGKILVDRMVQHVYSFDDGQIEHMEIRE
jgi:SnoaL-like domain